MLNHISNFLRFFRSTCRSRSSLRMYREILFSQILFLLLAHGSTQQGLQHFEPLDDHGGGGGGNSECALLLEGPGRSSAFDYNLNTLRGNPNYNGPNTCITYDAVNNAYIQARKYIRVPERREHYEHEELATIGELLLEVSRILARTYGLSLDEIEHGLPLIDTSKTHVREICPAFLSNVHCQAGKYRRYDGLCNNLKHPTWGAVQAPFARLLKPVYADSMSEPRVGYQGSTLPPPRIVSRTIHPDEGYHDHAATILLISWGQFMDHDLTLTATPLDPLTRNELEECCNRPPNARNPYCHPIDIPHDDPFYGVYGVRCIDFVRGFPAVRAGCRLGSRNQFNILTAIIDGNTVYGVEEGFARSLRSGYGGLLRMNPVFAQYGLHDLLPLKLDIPEEGCTRPNRSMYCFDAGEIRVNEQLVLTCMHTLMAREHNRVAHRLGEVNPHWDDEILYQEARRIVIAEIQHVTYNEFLPLVLGKEVMAKFGLLLQKDGYWDGYDPNVNSGVLASFAAAAFRFGHSLLPTNVERWSKAHKFIASRRLRDLIRQPFDLYRAGVIDEYFMGMANQVAQAMDDSVTQEVTNHLFRKPGQPFGVDLAAFNMARGREFGLPSYMEYRKYCGLPGAEGWDELFGSMNNITVKRYSQIYVHPQDIDLWSGGVSERPLPGAMVGPTFACIIASQYSNSRRGDRFWYELGGHPHSFTLEQLAELRKARLARIVCDNTDIIDTIQLYPMVLPDHEINPRVPCRSGVLLNIDFSKWADYGGHGGQFSQHNPVHVDKPSLNAGFGNDPSIGKYVNQDGLQQLRHYLKVGPYSTFKSQNPFIGYIKKIIEKGARTAIDGTQGQDLSNLANVVYSPNPVFEPDPLTPLVDLGPRGQPINPPFIPLKSQQIQPNFVPQPGSFAPPPPVINNNQAFASSQPPQFQPLPPVLNNGHPQQQRQQGPGAGFFRDQFDQQLQQQQQQFPMQPRLTEPQPIFGGFKPVASPYGDPILPETGDQVPNLLQTLESVLNSDRNIFKRSPILRRIRKDKSELPIVIAGGSIRVKRDAPDSQSKSTNETIGLTNATPSKEEARATSTADADDVSLLTNPFALRNAVINSALEIMDGLTDLSKQLIMRLRNSTSELFSSSSSNTSASPSASSPAVTSVVFVPLEAQTKNGQSSSSSSSGSSSSSSSANINSNSNSQALSSINSKPTPLLASFLDDNMHQLNMTKQRIELAKRATSFVTRVLKDISARASRGMEVIHN